MSGRQNPSPNNFCSQPCYFLCFRKAISAKDSVSLFDNNSHVQVTFIEFNAPCSSRDTPAAAFYLNNQFWFQILGISQYPVQNAKIVLVVSQVHFASKCLQAYHKCDVGVDDIDSKGMKPYWGVVNHMLRMTTLWWMVSLNLYAFDDKRMVNGWPVWRKCFASWSYPMTLCSAPWSRHAPWNVFVQYTYRLWTGLVPENVINIYISMMRLGGAGWLCGWLFGSMIVTCPVILWGGSLDGKSGWRGPSDFKNLHVRFFRGQR